ncbi:MAG: hypothetical protein C5B49_14535 [Bdellovibrio sp.]|nr:MAG: hypothetical protein C5B49_14535 [Bdellovibrio sp.]
MEKLIANLPTFDREPRSKSDRLTTIFEANSADHLFPVTIIESRQRTLGTHGLKSHGLNSPIALNPTLKDDTEKNHTEKIT